MWNDKICDSGLRGYNKIQNWSTGAYHGNFFCNYILERKHQTAAMEPSDALDQSQCDTVNP